MTRNQIQLLSLLYLLSYFINKLNQDYGTTIFKLFGLTEWLILTN